MAGHGAGAGGGRAAGDARRRRGDRSGVCAGLSGGAGRGPGLGAVFGAQPPLRGGAQHGHGRVLSGGGRARRAGAPGLRTDGGADSDAVAADRRPGPGTDRHRLLVLGHRHQTRRHRRARHAVVCGAIVVHRPAAGLRPRGAALDPGGCGVAAAGGRLAEPAGGAGSRGLAQGQLPAQQREREGNQHAGHHHPHRVRDHREVQRDQSEQEGCEIWRRRHRRGKGLGDLAPSAPERRRALSAQ